MQGSLTKYDNHSKDPMSMSWNWQSNICCVNLKLQAGCYALARRARGPFSFLFGLRGRSPAPQKFTLSSTRPGVRDHGKKYHTQPWKAALCYLGICCVTQWNDPHPHVSTRLSMGTMRRSGKHFFKVSMAAASFGSFQIGTRTHSLAI